MNSQQILLAQFDDILFDGRNKDYGAYMLRKSYNKRMGMAILLAVSGLAIFLASAKISEHQATHTPLILTPIETVDISDDVTKEPITIEQKPPSETPQVDQVKFSTNIVIEKDNTIPHGDLPNQNDLTDVVISNHNVTGLNNGGGNLLTDVDFSSGSGTGGGIDRVEINKPNDNFIHDIVEQEPIYPGGYDAIQSFVQQNFHYTNSALESGIEGKIIVRFVVEKDGSITQVSITRGLGYGLDQEAIRVISKLNKFKPAFQNGQAVRVYFDYPLNLKIQ